MISRPIGNYCRYVLVQHDSRHTAAEMEIAKDSVVEIYKRGGDQGGVMNQGQRGG
jgi:hypothetical protein